nr:TPA_asm: m126-m128 uORF [Murid betaherpesvirus 1]DBA07907.1 TPA_asm: m126-m128 uORF [Murid betaherpesvirus 1]
MRTPGQVLLTCCY